MERVRLTVEAEHAGERLDRWLAGAVATLSRSRAAKLIASGAVTVNGAPVDKASRTVAGGERVEVVVPPEPAVTELEPEPIPLAVLWEDDHLAVIDKPAGLVVHPAPGNRTGTLVHALLHRWGERLAGSTRSIRPGIVHRLDKGTTGVMVVALEEAAHERLAAQFAARTVEKDYLALVYGSPDDTEGTIDQPLGRDRHDRKKISTATNRPRAATTDWRVIETLPGLSLIHARPRTGRTHQIRAHLAWLHHPLVGDDIYAGRQYRGIQEGRIRSLLAAFGRPALHAWKLAFDHPVSGERLRFEAEVPADLRVLLETLRRWRDGDR